MHLCIIRRPTLGPNLKGKLKFICIIHSHPLAVQRSDCELRLHESFINYTVRPRPWWITVVAVTIDAHHCRWEMCRQKHFSFCQKYSPRPHTSAEDRHTVITVCWSALRYIVCTDSCTYLFVCGPVIIWASSEWVKCVITASSCRLSRGTGCAALLSSFLTSETVRDTQPSTLIQYCCIFTGNSNNSLSMFALSLNPTKHCTLC